MIHLIITCVLLIAIQCATAVPVKNSKIVPVDLAYECVHKTEKAVSKPPIILLHGMDGMMSTWDGTYEALAFKTGRRVCRADLRNHGESPWDDETSVAAMAEDTIHLLDIIGEKTAVIIGHSLGGKIAIHTAMTYPERVASIVAEDIVPNLSSDGVEVTINNLKTLLDMMDKVPEGSDEKQAFEILSNLMRELYKQMNVTITEDQLKEGLSMFTCSGGKCRWKVNYKAFLNAMEKDFYSLWTITSGVSEVPALFIYGKASGPTKVNEHEEEIRKLFPNAKLVGVEEAGHFIHGLFPQFEEEVLKFLEETNTLL